ncbi:MAG: glycosyltransferase family 4 protein [Actinomycetota bacterium]|nr:glycosyltransferase family 4 protein [Actinomycetota bacterium]
MGDGSALYSRQLAGALVRAGVDVDVLSTRAVRLQERGPFDLRWTGELPAREYVDGSLVRRFDAVSAPDIVARAANRMVLAAWRREDEREGRVVPGSALHLPSLVSRARRRRGWIDTLAECGRGPVAPGLLAHVARTCHDYDVVLVGHAPFAIMRHVQGIAAARGTPVVVLPFLHETDPFHHFSGLYRAYERAGAVLVLSKYSRRVMGEQLPRAHVVAIGAGANVERHTDPDRVAAFRARHGLEDRRILLLVGRKEPSKRYDIAIEALASLPPDVVLVMVGRDVDGRPLPTERIRHLGALSDEELLDAYAACEALLVPSEHESFGMVCLEAWLQAKPVIANARCGPLAALVEPERDGLLCAQSDEWATAASTLLEHPEWARSLGEAGRKKVLERYTWERVAERVVDVYTQAADPTGRRSAC